MALNYIKKRAKQSFIAIKNPYESVLNVFPQIFDNLSSSKESYYVGIKDNNLLTRHSLQPLLASNQFLLHTIDKASPRGRAIDPFLQHPITTLPMTGSSSGTALNVFLGINNLGIGTDGGGSVLAPALSLNLYSIMSPLLSLLEEADMKVSTDNISFTPSAGLLSKELDIIYQAMIELNLIEDKKNNLDLSSLKILSVNDSFVNSPLDIQDSEQMTIDITSPRSELIDWLKIQLDAFDIIVSKEGPIDTQGLGDSIIGHFDEATKTYQQASNKGLLRVVNMVGATAITVPTSALATGYVLIAKSEKEILPYLMEVSSLFEPYQDELIERYFGDLGMYF